MQILMKSAVYHDIGRTHDHTCYVHGKDSVKKLYEINGFSNIDNEYNEILKYIIENHCINDETAFNNINKYKIQDKDRALFLLRIFKDADNLDRVRIKDLDIKYLREAESKKLPIIAMHILNGVE